MTWYNIRKLERRLAADEINEKESYHYLSAFLIFLAVIIFFPESPTSYTGFYWDLAEFLIFLIFLILALRNSYLINTKGHNTDFVKRFISLVLVHGFRLLIWVGVFGLFYKIIMFIIPLQIFNFINDLLLPDWTELIIFSAIFLLYYIFIMRSFKRINSAAF